MFGLITPLITSLIITISAPFPHITAPSALARPSHGAITITTAVSGVYTTRPGDTLSSVARREWGNAASWPALWWDNRDTVPNPNVLGAGQHLRFGTWHRVRPWLRRAALHAIPAPQPAAAPAAPAPAASAPPPSGGAYVSVSGVGGAFGACVRQRENGGSYAWGTGDGGGAYQFQYATWIAYGGSPSGYGSAGPAEQDRVFMNAIAAGGQGNWAPYDGC